MLQFFPDKHLYTWNGKPAISVTQLFSLVGTRKSKDDSFRSISGVEFIKSDIAALFGREFHKFAEIILKGGEADYDEALKPYVNSFYKFLGRYPHILGDSQKLVEYKAYSQRYKYAGMLDLFSFMMDTYGRLWLIDWKTSDTIAPHYKYQLAAYTQLIKENFNILKDPYTMTVCLKPDKEPQCEIRKPSEVKLDFNTFLSILNVFNLTQKLYTKEYNNGQK